MCFLGYKLIVNTLVWKNYNFHSRNRVALQTIRWGSLKATHLLGSYLNGAANWNTGWHCWLHLVHQYGLNNCLRQIVETRLPEEEVFKISSLSRKIQPPPLKIWNAEWGNEEQNSSCHISLARLTAEVTAWNISYPLFLMLLQSHIRLFYYQSCISIMQNDSSISSLRHL